MLLANFGLPVQTMNPMMVVRVSILSLKSASWVFHKSLLNGIIEGETERRVGVQEAGLDLHFGKVIIPVGGGAICEEAILKITRA